MTEVEFVQSEILDVQGNTLVVAMVERHTYTNGDSTYWVSYGTDQLFEGWENKDKLELSVDNRYYRGRMSSTIEEAITLLKDTKEKWDKGELRNPTFISYLIQGEKIKVITEGDATLSGIKNFSIPAGMLMEEAGRL